MKKRLYKGSIIKALFSFLFLTILVIAVGAYFVFDKALVGPAFLGLGVISVIFLRIMNIRISRMSPDLIYGFIDNGVMVFAAIIGGNFGGVSGAVIGGVAGNTITDGIGGFAEGYISENFNHKKSENKRTALSSSLLKMTGCMFGAGTSLTLIYIFSLIF